MKTVKDLITNKKVVFYGDSITHNWEKFDHDLNLTHTDPNHEYGLGYGHVKMMNDVCHFKTVDNFAVSGGCYANTYYLNPQRPVWRHFPHQIVVSKDKLIAADVIFIMMGSNDFSEQTPFGYYKEVATDHNQDNMTFLQGINFGYQKTNSGTEVINALKTGNSLVIAHMGKGYFTNNGHYIVLSETRDDGKVYVHDPNNKMNKSDRNTGNGWYDINDIVDQLKASFHIMTKS